MKRIIVLCLLAIILCGCGNQAEPTETTTPSEIELWLITEETKSDGMNDVTKKLIRQFENSYSNVSIHMEVLPTNVEDREPRLEQIRTQIMAGYGPDIFLLPTLSNDPLIDDVSLAMQNGIFQDISDYYDEDKALDKEALETMVMDAGVVDGARYALPLAYNFPVIYADPAYLEEKGLNFSEAGVDVLTFFDAVIALDDPSLAVHAIPPTASAQAEGFSLFSDTIDYASGDILLSESEVSAFMEKFQTLNAMSGSTARWEVNIQNYILYADAQETNTKLDADSLDHAMDFAAIAKSIDQDVSMIPLRAADGDLVANVTYYAAVGSGCAESKLAYEFIRLFLLEETQWEANRAEDEFRQAGTMLRGWPVRSQEATSSLWENSYDPQIKKNTKYFVLGEEVKNGTKRGNALAYVNLNEGDIPVLNIPIDRARFQPAEIEIAFRETLGTLNDWQNHHIPTDVDIHTLAKELIQNLQWHVAEG